MIAKLTGTLDTIGETSLILDVNGVGYLVACSTKTLSSLGHKGTQVTLFIETVMKAESLHLYGFKTAEEQSCFCLLTTVQGVGVRMALSLLSALFADEIYQAIALQDKTALTRAEGVGPKLASRILAELKDKTPSLSHFSSSPPPTSSFGPGFEEAISALVNLGYRHLEAATAISKITSQSENPLPLQDLIRQGLSLLARGAA